MALSFISRGFKSFYRSGTEFSEQIAPKWLGAKAGAAVGGVLGLASVATGACFLAAIPMSLPMFFFASGIFASKGIVAAVAVTGFLGGVGGVVTTTGLGMTRALVKNVAGVFSHPKKKEHAPTLPPEKSAFKEAGLKTDFKNSVKPETPVVSQIAPAVAAPQP